MGTTVASGDPQRIPSAPEIEFRFERGEIRATGLGPPPLYRGVLPDSFRWDPDRRSWRAPGYCYRGLRTWIASRANGGAAYRAARPEGFAPVRVPPENWPPLRPYQEEALRAWKAAGERGLVALPTGAGKTRLSVRAILALARPAIVLVPTRQLLRQWIEAIAQYYPGPIGAWGDGGREIQPITVSTYASARAGLERFGDRFDILVVDEAHHLPSPQLAQTARMAIAPSRLGLTGSPPEDRAQRDVVEDVLGPTCFALPAARLAGTYLAPYEVKVLLAKLDRAERAAYDRLRASFLRAFRPFAEAQPEAPWTEFVRQASASPEGRESLRAFRASREILARAKSKFLILDALLDAHRDEPKLVFAGDNAAAYEISRRFLVPAITCETRRAERAEILERFARGVYRTIVSAKVLNEGLDVPEASVAIVTGGTSSPLEHAQRIGRVLRPAHGKKAIVYELVAPGTADWRASERRGRSNVLSAAPEV
ncbi:MAG: DEAD/DEAH box helicase [Planctomycetota bacterium]